jgi:hypothetical protein
MKALSAGIDANHPRLSSEGTWGGMLSNAMNFQKIQNTP